MLREKDKDKYDFFIYEIYNLTWGTKPFDEIDESEKSQQILKWINTKKTSQVLKK